MTPPVQKHHFALGHKYQFWDSSYPRSKKVERTYMGFYRHADGFVTHVFVMEYFDEKCQKYFCLPYAEHDNHVFISLVEE